MTVRNQVESLTGLGNDMMEYDENADPRETARHNDDPPRHHGIPTPDGWMLQVSIKTTAGTLINVRGMSQMDVGMGLEDVRNLAAQIAEVENLFGAHAALAPVHPLPVPQQQQPPSFVPQGHPAGSQMPQGQAPMCLHGTPAKFVQGGISRSTGRPYRAFWACAQPRESQCDFRQGA